MLVWGLRIRAWPMSGDIEGCKKGRGGRQSEVSPWLGIGVARDPGTEGGAYKAIGFGGQPCWSLRAERFTCVVRTGHERSRLSGPAELRRSPRSSGCLPAAARSVRAPTALVTFGGGFFQFSTKETRVNPKCRPALVAIKPVKWQWKQIASPE